MRKVGFTGTQRGMTDLQKAMVVGVLTKERSEIAYHGGCIGADMDFDDICYRSRPHGLVTVIYPSNIVSKRGRWHYTLFVMPSDNPLLRNHLIVDNSDFLIATPKECEEVVRSGTWATIRYAIEKHKPVYIIGPDGSIKRR